MKKGGHIRGNFGPDFLFQLEDQEVAQSNAGPNEENIAGVLG